MGVSGMGGSALPLVGCSRLCPSVGLVLVLGLTLCGHSPVPTGLCIPTVPPVSLPPTGLCNLTTGVLGGVG